MTPRAIALLALLAACADAPSPSRNCTAIGDASVCTAIPCGARGQLCCDAPSPCAPSLACAAGYCVAPVADCTFTGVLDPRMPRASIAYRAVPECRDFPPELLPEARTPALLPPGDAPVGSLSCRGLRPGIAVLRLRGGIRLADPVHFRPMDCHCNGPWRVGLYFTTQDGANHPTPNIVGGNPADASCRDGPSLSHDFTVTVAADGRVSAQLFLATCERGGATRCLFQQDFAVTVAQ